MGLEKGTAIPTKIAKTIYTAEWIFAHLNLLLILPGGAKRQIAVFQVGMLT